MGAPLAALPVVGLSAMPACRFHADAPRPTGYRAFSRPRSPSRP